MKKITSLLLFCLFSYSGFAQLTQDFDNTWIDLSHTKAVSGPVGWDITNTAGITKKWIRDGNVNNQLAYTATMVNVPFTIAGSNNDSNILRNNREAASKGESHPLVKAGDSCDDPISVGSTLPYFTIDNTANYSYAYNNIGCGGPGSYLNTSTVFYSYTATFTGQIDINLSNAYANTGMFVYTSCANIGVSCAASGTGNRISLSAFNVTQGLTYYIVIGSEKQKQLSTPYTLIISKNNCSSTIITNFNVETNCALPFKAVANVTNMGGATSLMAKIYKNGIFDISQTISATGQYSFGPYADTDEIQILINSLQNPNCYVSSTKLTKKLCTPVNDNCSNTIVLTPTTTGNYDYISQTGQNLYNATPSTEANTCLGNADDDVWFQFTALNTKNYINLRVSDYGPYANMSHILYKGTNCNDLTQLYCSNSLQSVADNLVIGQTYKIRVYSTGSTKIPGTYSIAVNSIAPSCIDNNPKSQIIKGLFIDLLNHLISVRNTIARDQPYECPQLTALAPYLTDANPKIYFNTSFPGAYLNFSFTNHPSSSGRTEDVYVNDIPPGVTISNIELYKYTSPETKENMYISLSDGRYPTMRDTDTSRDVPNNIQHINFCPECNIAATFKAQCTNCTTTGTFNAITNITNLGGSTITAKVYDNDALVTTQMVSALGQLSFGPYAGSHTVKIILQSSDKAYCSVAGTITPDNCKPINDNCNTPTPLTVNTTNSCTNVTPVIFTCATTSTTPACTGINGPDLWYEFTATQQAHTIALSGFTITGWFGCQSCPAAQNITLSLYNSNCSALGTPLYCSNNNIITATSLIPGVKYKVRVAINNNDPRLDTAFNICITTPPPPTNTSQNDCVITTTNPSFETPNINLATNSLNNTTVSQNIIQGWRTTAADGLIEFWPIPNNQNVASTASGTGKWFIELNAETASNVYQDYATPMPTVFKCKFAHRGRAGVDTCVLKAGPPNGPFTVIATATTGNTGWKYYGVDQQISYQVPANQPVTRFLFEAVSTATNNNTIGNFLDEVTFTADNGIISVSPTVLDCTSNTATVVGAGVGRWIAHNDNPSSTIIANYTANTTTITGFNAAGIYLYDWVTEYCTSTFQLTYGTSTMPSPPTCIETNPQAPAIKNLFKTLLNHLISFNATISSTVPYDCPELRALAPYITDANPKIYNFKVENGLMSFSFSNTNNIDVIIPTSNTISTIDFKFYTSPSQYAGVFINNATVCTNSIYKIKHVNFCADCGIAATFTTQCVDCASSPTFTTIANISSMGGATQILASVYKNGTVVATQTITSTGSKSFGPFVSGDIIQIGLKNQQNTSCTISSPVFTTSVCRPVNDDCANATILTPTTTGNYYLETQSIYLATPSQEGINCPGNTGDVWYEFTAISTNQYIDINVVNGFGTLNHSVYSGNNCNSLTQLYCTSGMHSLATNLVVGQTYKIRVYTIGGVSQICTFSIVINSIAPSCIDTNQNSPVVKQLFINLLNHLINVRETVSITEPYECAELTALAPYISDPNPKIYFHTAYGNALGFLNFSFADHPLTSYATADVFINTLQPGQYINDLALYSYTTANVKESMYLYLTDGTFVNSNQNKPNSVSHINFCPNDVTEPGFDPHPNPGGDGGDTSNPPPCSTVINSTIKMGANEGTNCVIINTPIVFSVLSDAKNVSGYHWSFYNSTMALISTSTIATPVITFTQSDIYLCVLTINTIDGCTDVVQKSLTVDSTCNSCVNNNPQTAVIKQLYINLINHLLRIYPESSVPEGYTCPELIALMPYITVYNPAIYGATYDNGRLSFSFIPNQEYPDFYISDDGDIDDINLFNYTGPEDYYYTITVYKNGNLVDNNAINHINFCAEDCAPLNGNIELNSGLSCIQPYNPVNMSLEIENANINSYDWTIYAPDGNVLYHTNAANPTINYYSEGNYNVELFVTNDRGCGFVFFKTITVSSNCSEACTEVTPNAAIVKQLYTNLVNHLITIYNNGGTLSNPYTCPQLTALAPYITENNPLIWNVSYNNTNNILKFSFNNHGTDYDVSTYGAALISDINLVPYTLTNSRQSFFTRYQDGTASDEHSVRYINFCSSKECVALTGQIQLSSGLSCVVVSAPLTYSLVANSVNITSYQWTFYDQGGTNPWFTSSLVKPEISYASPGDYKIKLVVTERSGCISTFYKYITVGDASTCASACTETNEDTPLVKKLYINLLNHLLSLPNVPADGYTCSQLSELAPYITDGNPYIYAATFTASNNMFSFKFSSSPDAPYIYVQKNGLITNIDLFNYSDTTSNNYSLTYANGMHSYHSASHINFCPDPPPCESHIAFVIDESGSISDTEAAKIKAQLYAFIDQQEGSNMTVSFTGMSDTDFDTRKDHVYNKINSGTKQEFENWISKYKTPYSAASRGEGISSNSDYWVSGLTKALTGYDLRPEIIIVITDGSQTSNIQGFKDTIAKIKNDPSTHLYVYGLGSGSYVDGYPATENPNDDPPATAISEVSMRLMNSLKFLMQLPPKEFPAYSSTDLLSAAYYEYPDFSNLEDDLRYFSDKLAIADLGCGGAPVPKDYCNDCQTFQPTPKAEYWISGWIKEEQNIQVKTYTNGVLKLIFEDGDDYQLGILSLLPSGEIIDGWQRIAAKFEVPEFTSIMKIELENISNNIPVYFDDIRVHPVKGSMKSFVYDPVTFKLMAELDDNNYSTFYEYDNEGGLIRIKKETSKGVQTIQESRSGNVITPIQN